MIKKDVPFRLSQQHKDAIFEINESLLKATKVSLKLPLPDKQLAIMCDASEHAAGYVLLTEDYAEPSAKQTYAPVAFGSKKFQGGQNSLTMFAKEFDEFDALHLMNLATFCGVQKNPSLL